MTRADTRLRALKKAHRHLEHAESIVAAGGAGKKPIAQLVAAREAVRQARQELAACGPAALQAELDRIIGQRQRRVDEVRRRIQDKETAEWIDGLRAQEEKRHRFVTVRTRRTFTGLKLDGGPDFRGGEVVKVARPVRRARWTGLKL